MIKPCRAMANFCWISPHELKVGESSAEGTDPCLETGLIFSSSKARGNASVSARLMIGRVKAKRHQVQGWDVMGWDGVDKGADEMAQGVI